MPKTLRLCGLARKLKKQADFFAILIFIRIFAPSESPQGLHASFYLLIRTSNWTLETVKRAMTINIGTMHNSMRGLPHS